METDLRQLAKYTEVQGSQVEIRHLEEQDNSTGWTGLDLVQIVYIAGSESHRLEELIQILQGYPILTVGDTPGFAKRGVHINFFIENERVRFELNRRTCGLSGLGFSFRLQSVARSVE